MSHGTIREAVVEHRGPGAIFEFVVHLDTGQESDMLRVRSPLALPTAEMDVEDLVESELREDMPIVVSGYLNGA